MKARSLTFKFLAIAILAMFAVLAIAQDTTKTEVTKEQASQSYQVEKGEVVYVSGNEVVVRMQDGTIRSVTAPEGATATVDGKVIAVKDLRPGMKLQRTITTTTTPELVTTIRTIQGKVWQVSAPKTVILTLPDGQNKKYNVPKDQVFMIDGKEMTVFDLKKGMNVTATVLTQMPQTAVAHEKAVTGQMPPPPETPAIQGALLIESPSPAKVEVAQTEPVKKLPKTGSVLPLIGLLGLGSSMLGLGIRKFRTK
jgi:RNase P/RNase MRP subunit p29